MCGEKMAKSPKSPRNEYCFGDIPDGWTAQGWCEWLRYLAKACEEHHSERADELRRWAEKVEAEHGDK